MSATVLFLIPAIVFLILATFLANELLKKFRFLREFVE